MTDLVFHNANVVTMNPSQPYASVVATHKGVVKWVGEAEDLRYLTSAETRLIDCDGATLLPAFHDAHCHLLGLASSFLSVDCSPLKAASLVDIQNGLRLRAEVTPLGQWIRARGYHEALLRDRRHPTREDLDKAAPHHPVKLTHQTGHASVLNSLGLAAVGIHEGTSDPPYGIIERDLRNGIPTGLLLEMEDYLDQRLPPINPWDLEIGIAKAFQLLLSHGVAAVQDASLNNSLERWQLWSKLRSNGNLLLRLALMPGLGQLDEFYEAGMGFGFGDQYLRIGHAKAMLTMTTGALYPSVAALKEQALKGVLKDFPIAIHAVELEAVAGALEVLQHVKNTRPELRHRIEHASECSTELADALARSDITVVTQPGFLYYNGDRYLKEVPEENRKFLYPLRSLNKSGVMLAGSSDAPVIPVDPLMGIAAAVTRATAEKQYVNKEQELTPFHALRMYTEGSAYAGFLEHVLGSIKIGKYADMVLVDKNPLIVEPDELKDLRVVMTILSSEIVWEA